MTLFSLVWRQAVSEISQISCLRERSHLAPFEKLDSADHNLLKLADQYGVREAVDSYFEIMENQHPLEARNAAKFLELAVTFNVDSMRQRAASILASSTQAFDANGSFYGLFGGKPWKPHFRLSHFFFVCWYLLVSSRVLLCRSVSFNVLLVSWVFGVLAYETSFSEAG